MTTEGDLPPRLTTAEVCALARYGRSTLAREIRQGRMPAPIRTGRPQIFLRDAVLQALGLLAPPEPINQSSWDLTDHARDILQSRNLRHRSAKAGRVVPGPVRGAAPPSSPRLAIDNTAPR